MPATTESVRASCNYQPLCTDSSTALSPLRTDPSDLSQASRTEKEYLILSSPPPYPTFHSKSAVPSGQQAKIRALRILIAASVFVPLILGLTAVVAKTAWWDCREDTGIAWLGKGTAESGASEVELHDDGGIHEGDHEHENAYPSISRPVATRPPSPRVLSRTSARVRVRFLPGTPAHPHKPTMLFGVQVHEKNPTVGSRYRLSNFLRNAMANARNAFERFKERLAFFRRHGAVGGMGAVIGYGKEQRDATGGQYSAEASGGRVTAMESARVISPAAARQRSLRRRQPDVEKVDEKEEEEDDEEEEVDCDAAGSE